MEEHDPNEILVKKFNEQEIQMISDDPNYFIKSDKARQNINLFESNEDEFSVDPEATLTKNKGKIIKEEFYKKSKEDKVRQEISEYIGKYGESRMPAWMHRQH